MSTGASIPSPDFGSVLRQLKTDIFTSLNCHLNGSIVSFNPAGPSASVQISYLRQVGDVTIPYPVLVDCPVMVLSGGHGFITLPIAPGDPCLVLFNDRNIDNWWSYERTAAPNTPRKHDLSDGFVIVGFRPKTKPVPSYSSTDIEIKNNGGLIAVEAKIGVSNASGSLKSSLDQLIETLINWVDTNGDTPNVATVAALNTVKSSIDNLLK